MFLASLIRFYRKEVYFMKKVFSIVVVLCALISLSIGCEAARETKEYIDEDIYLFVVNKQNKIPRNWSRVMQIDTVRNCLNEKIRIEHKTYEQFLLLQKELLDKEGIKIEIDDAYRSIKEQQEIWDKWSADPELGSDYCAKYLAPPGYSEHHTGLAIDIFLIKNDQPIRENDDMLANTEDFAIIHNYLPKYGFILRYPNEKEYITGYSYEPWHVRYIDNKDIALEIAENSITLEEHLANNY